MNPRKDVDRRVWVCGMLPCREADEAEMDGDAGAGVDARGRRETRYGGAGYMTPAWKKDRRVPVADPGRTERKKRTLEEAE